MEDNTIKNEYFFKLSLLALLGEHCPRQLAKIQGKISLDL